MKVTLELNELARDRMVEALRAANLEVLARATEYQTGTCPHPDCPPGLCEDQPEPQLGDHLSENLDSCIWIDPSRQSGQPCFGGTRVPVAIVMILPDEAIPDWYPSVTPEHIKAMRWWLAQPLVKDMLRSSL